MAFTKIFVFLALLCFNLPAMAGSVTWSIEVMDGQTGVIGTFKPELSNRSFDVPLGKSSWNCTIQGTGSSKYSDKKERFYSQLVCRKTDGSRVLSNALCVDDTTKDASLTLIDEKSLLYEIKLICNFNSSKPSN